VITINHEGHEGHEGQSGPASLGRTMQSCAKARRPDLSWAFVHACLVRRTGASTRGRASRADAGPVSHALLRDLRVLRGLFLVTVLSGCVDRLPTEDRRITIVTPLAKLSAADLWNDYQKDGAGANRRYFGEAVEVSGKVTGIDTSAKGGAVVMFGQTETLGLRAVLLGDQEAAILKTAKVNERLTLRCFVEGRILEGHVGLRSCIRP
jgi:hypothetical protein